MIAPENTSQSWIRFWFLYIIDWCSKHMLVFSMNSIAKWLMQWIFRYSLAANLNHFTRDLIHQIPEHLLFRPRFLFPSTFFSRDFFLFCCSRCFLIHFFFSAHVYYMCCFCIRLLLDLCLLIWWLFYAFFAAYIYFNFYRKLSTYSFPVASYIFSAYRLLFFVILYFYFFLLLVFSSKFSQHFSFFFFSSLFYFNTHINPSFLQFLNVLFAIYFL